MPLRRGSNVSLMLDMSSLGSVEPIQPVCTPRDITLQFLRTSSRVLSKEELQQHAQSLAQLQEEFSVRYPQPLALLARGMLALWGLVGFGSFPLGDEGSEPGSTRGRGCGRTGWGGHGAKLFSQRGLSVRCPTTAGVRTGLIPAAGVSGGANRSRGSVPLPVGPDPPRRGDASSIERVFLKIVLPPCRKSHPTSSVWKSWRSLDMPPRTDTKPSSPVRAPLCPTSTQVP